MPSDLIVVEAFRPAPGERLDLRKEALSFALDQRAFGPRKLIVAFARRSGRMTAFAYTDRTEPPHLGLTACCDHVGRGADIAIAFSDETVGDEQVDDELHERFVAAKNACRAYGIRLYDWICCDDTLFRSLRVACDPHAQIGDWKVFEW